MPLLPVLRASTHATGRRFVPVPRGHVQRRPAWPSEPWL